MKNQWIEAKIRCFSVRLRTFFIVLLVLNGCTTEDGGLLTPLQRDRDITRRFEGIDRRPPPASTYLAFTARNSGELRGILERSMKAPAISDDLVLRLKSDISASIPLKENQWTYYLGLESLEQVRKENWTPILLVPSPERKVPMVLTEVCLDDQGCMACQSTVKKATDQAPEAPAVPPMVKKFQGICSTIATAWSLVKLDLVPLGPGVGNSAFFFDENLHPTVWRKSFLAYLREQQGHTPGDGTPRKKIAKAYEGLGAECDEETSAPKDAAGLQRWCEGLQNGNEEKDYSFHLDSGPDDDPTDWAHAMHIYEVKWNKDQARCEVIVRDTGRQGGGGGDDVPVQPGFQEWHISSGTNGLNIAIQQKLSGTDATSVGFPFWNGLPPAINASHICCSRPDEE